MDAANRPPGRDTIQDWFWKGREHGSVLVVHQSQNSVSSDSVDL